MVLISCARLSDRRMDSIMQSVAGIPYDSNKPWPFWFFIGKIISKAFFGDEERLEWLNAVRVRTREFIAFTNIRKDIVSNQDKSTVEKARLQVAEIDFSKPQPGKTLEFFWKPARGIICQKVQDCEWMLTPHLFLLIHNLTIVANRARLLVKSGSRRRLSLLTTYSLYSTTLRIELCQD